MRARVSRPKFHDIRPLSHTAVLRPEKETSELDEHNGNLLDFQLSARRADGTRIPESFPFVEHSFVTDKIGRTPSYSLNNQFAEIEVGLEMSEINIEKLEGTLLDIRLPKTLVSDETTSNEELNPWYQREDGDISEVEYLSIEKLLKSHPESQTSKLQKPQIVRDNPHHAPLNMLPWYLREQEEDTTLVPKIDIHKTRFEQYPALPANSPPLLQPLVSRLFYDHHLQNIVLLDLRNRDPPPVWGSNTIMILATGRNERQLTSVAEATKRWLRTTAGVEPRIDGLPKRESVVLKRRRLRRKSLRKPGYLITAVRSTTWVSMYTGYQGIMLQLFTEQGREEYDLEGLWGDKRVIDVGILDMKPRKVRPGGLEEDEPIETTQSTASHKKPLWKKKAENKQKKLDLKKEKKAAKRRWTKEEKEQARQRRMQEPSMMTSSKNFLRSGRVPSGISKLNRQQHRQYHTLGTIMDVQV